MEGGGGEVGSQVFSMTLNVAYASVFPASRGAKKYIKIVMRRAICELPDEIQSRAEAKRYLAEVLRPERSMYTEGMFVEPACCMGCTRLVMMFVRPLTQCETPAAGMAPAIR